MWLRGAGFNPNGQLAQEVIFEEQKLSEKNLIFGTKMQENI